MGRKIFAVVVLVLLVASVSHAGIISKVKSSAKSTASTVKSTASNVKNTASNTVNKVTNTPSGQAGQVVSTGSVQHTGTGTPPQRAGTTTSQAANNQSASGTAGSMFGNN